MYEWRYLEFVMLVGLPASGKTTHAHEMKNDYEEVFKQEYIILSSDEVRKDLYGDENIQGDSSEVFRILHDKVIDSLKDNISVIYDATNITIKNRKSILDKIKEFSKENNKEIRIGCEILATPIDKCIEQNSKRERKVPDNVIYSMQSKFQLPLYREGFDFIEFRRDEKNSCYYNFFFERKMRGFNQSCPYHDFDLDKHCELTAQYIDDNCCADEYSILLEAARLHDYGKLFTQSFDENGIAHYYNHENVGAYESYFYTYSIYKKGVIIDVMNLIFWHMLPYNPRSTKALDKIKNEYGKDFYDRLMLLHEADKAAH